LLNLDLVRDAFPNYAQSENKFAALEDKIRDEKDLLSIYKLLTRSLMSGRLTFGNKEAKGSSNLQA
jgi:hypothetical protein